MHPNPAFRAEAVERHLRFARDRAFGTLCVSADPAPLLSHLPFILSDDGSSADLHLVRSTPIARRGAGQAILSVTGPDGYVSPDWYGVPGQVPTWNYVAVHLRGRLERLPDAALQDLLDRQSAAFERRLAPKHEWTAAKMAPDVLDRMMRQIVPFRLHVEAVDGTWKLSQNKPDAVRLSAAGAVATSPAGQETASLADLMRSPHDRGIAHGTHHRGT